MAQYVTTTQCAQLKAAYDGMVLPITSMVALTSSVLGLANAALVLTNDAALDLINAALAGVTPPNVATKMDALVGNIADAIAECPALGDILPPELAGLTDPSKLPSKLFTGMTNDIRKEADALVAAALSGPQKAVMDAMLAYKRALKTSGLNDLITKLDKFENCLVAICALIANPDRKAAAFRTSLYMDGNGGLDFTRLAAAHGLTASKLTAAYGSYEAKFPL
jgi:hypothetical protein